MYEYSLHGLSYWQTLLVELSMRPQAPGAQAFQQRTLADIIADRIREHEGGGDDGDAGCARVEVSSGSGNRE